VAEEMLAAQRGGEASLSALNDDTMVWISRVIQQDVNIFVNAQLAATSERDLYASGLLPARIPGQAYRAIVLQRLPAFVGEDLFADLRYLMAAAPIRMREVDAVLTVPLALQQREIEREIDELDRGVQLGAVLFILLGAGVGYWLAQRISDPVERLTLASRRIAAGELSARVFVRTADELQRLVEAFNTMAVELERQRAQLEHTNRLEAWAEMARQVAHDIKNPLTPIQLSAEHLRRVHQDRGEPLSPVLERCVDTILAQVRLLRRISAEFSSFAATPVVRREPTDVGALVREVADSYRAGLDERYTLDVSVAPGLPSLELDRLLIGRAIVNVIENALHAMPSGGRLDLGVARQGDTVVIRVGDTGIGMDDEARARIFEPYFSTKTTGTGLGLPIAKRNVDLHGGSVAVESGHGAGTVVTFTLPVRTLEIDVDGGRNVPAGAAEGSQ
jgi:nitrogen fixation/metabolism regulation signal transduction histidine kinase